MSANPSRHPNAIEAMYNVLTPPPHRNNAQGKSWRS
jgi:hypothetical protein